MAKMFYTLSEAAQKLGMSEDDVRGLIETNQLQEFRDGGDIVLKVDQVDLLGGGGDDDEIGLAESGALEPISLSSSGSGSGLLEGDDLSDQTGISIFDPEGGEEADPSAATQISSAPRSAGDFGFDSATASGSGLANIALESDDTSLGADLLEDVYGSGGSAAGSAGGSAAGSAGASGLGSAAGIGDSGLGGSAVVDTGGELFESAGGEEGDIVAAPSAGVGAVMMGEAYDGAGSGIVGGVAVGMALTLLAAATVLIIVMFGGGAPIVEAIEMTHLYIGLGAMLGVMLVGAVVGWLLLRKS